MGFFIFMNSDFLQKLKLKLNAFRIAKSCSKKNLKLMRLYFFTTTELLLIMTLQDQNGKTYYY